MSAIEKREHIGFGDCAEGPNSGAFEAPLLVFSTGTLIGFAILEVAAKTRGLDWIEMAEAQIGP